jgi:hypothetical protein
MFHVHSTCKVGEKGFKMALMMNKYAMINSCEIILETQTKFFSKNHCEIKVHSILVCALYSIKYGRLQFLPGLSFGAAESYI